MHVAARFAPRYLEAADWRGFRHVHLPSAFDGLPQQLAAEVEVCLVEVGHRGGVSCLFGKRMQPESLEAAHRSVLGQHRDRRARPESSTLDLYTPSQIRPAVPSA